MTFSQYIKEKSSPTIKRIVYFSAMGLTTLFGFLLLFSPFCLFEQEGKESLVKLTPINSIIFLNNNVATGGLSYLGLILFILWLVYVIVTINILVKIILGLKKWDEKVKQRIHFLCKMNTFATGGYFLGSILFYYINKSFGGVSYLANNVLPFVLVIIIDILFALYLGIIKEEIIQEKDEKQIAQYKQLQRKRTELFLFTTGLVICAGLCFCLNIINVEFVINSEAFSDYNFSMKGLDVLKNYALMEEGGQVLAFVLFLAITIVLSFYLLSLISFLSKSNSFFRFALGAIIVSCLGCFLIGMYGKYYQIMQSLNAETIVDWIEKNIPESAPIMGQINSIKEDIVNNCKVTSDSFIFFILSLAMVGMLLASRPYSKGLMLLKTLYPENNAMKAEITKAEIVVSNIEDTSKRRPAPSSDINIEKNLSLFSDPCPAFTEIDGRKEKIDEELKKKILQSFENPTLPKVVQFIVEYARDSRLHLFYTKEDIATFIAGLGATKLTILQGMSGTGKTSLPKIFSEALYSECDIVEVESSWRDKNELLGYYNEFSKTYTPKKFTQALYNASLHPEILTFIVLDEMNLSRIEYYFSDFLSLMENEPDKRKIKLLNVGLFQTIEGEKYSYKGLIDGHTIKIPPNVWFIGTANRDESTFEISDKVYDRAHTINFNKRAKKANSYTAPLEQKFLSANVLNMLLEEAKKGSTFTVEGYPLIAEVEKLLEPYNISFGNRIALQIENFVAVYCACFEKTEEIICQAVERILLSKVVSKLELKSIENKEELATAFARLGLLQCSAFISKLNED